jgi:hypothetical protein
MLDLPQLNVRFAKVDRCREQLAIGAPGQSTQISFVGREGFCRPRSSRLMQFLREFRQ